MKNYLLILLLSGCAPQTLTALSLNVASGAGEQWRTPEARERQRQLIADTRPDVVCLQEVDVGTDRNHGASAMDVLPTTGTRVFGPSIYFGGGAYGNGLWLRNGLVVLDQKVTHYQNAYLDPEAKGALLAVVVTEGGRTLEIGCTHLSWLREEALNQLDQLRSFTVGTDVLLGDLNISTPIDIGNLKRMTPEGEIDQAWSTLPGTGYMVSTSGASDHAFAALTEVDL